MRQNKSPLFFGIFLILFLTTQVHAQIFWDNKPPKADNKTAQEAKRLWKEGNINEAEKLYRKAYENGGYTGHLHDLAYKKMEIGDFKNANVLYDTIITVLKRQLKGSTVMNNLYINQFYFEKIENNFKKGDPNEGLSTSLAFVKRMGEKVEATERMFFQQMYLSSCETAYLTENKIALENLNEDASKIKNGEYGVLVSFVYLCVLNGEYEKAITKLLFVTENGADFTNSKLTARTLLPLVYAKKGDYDLALAAIEKAKSSILVGNEYYQELYGYIALKKLNFPEAIERFSNALLGKKNLWARIEPVAKFKLYSYRAEANLGMGNLLLARKDYESALIYNPNYVPAIQGISTLEGKIISNRVADKTPPIITVSEPALNRGLKITSVVKDIMVKGFAADPSGLKSVSINGIKVYSKEGGDFWGSLPLIDGNNKLTIQAIDMADNMAEKVFEIEKTNPTSTITNSDIVPIQEKMGTNYILLIGSQNYADASIPSLENPISDAIKLKLALKSNYNFEDENVLTLFNPTVNDFKKKFIQISETIQPEDNLIIFYAGHGIWNEKEKKGYWLLNDAIRADKNTWLPNKAVLDMIAGVSARHTLLITDACFSGSVFKTRSIGADAPPAVREMSEKISRVAITSGNDTEVPDQSVFMKYLIKALNENKEKYLTAQKMFITQIIEAVMTESKTEPRYGTLELAGHVGGDFIFIKK